MIILGIETSCDETAAAVLTNTDKQSLRSDLKRITILSNVVASSASLQAKYGGIIPEQAAREQIKSIIPVIEESLTQAFPNYEPRTTNYPPIDAIAVTYGPGLIGSLLVGVETAKVLATIWKKPLIPVNHLIGHFYANWITNDTSLRASAKQSNQETNSQIASSPSAPRNDSNDSSVPTFPCIGLLVSGGHTDLVLFTDHGKYKYLGGTRDDAAGECFDKCARLLGLPYPGGPEISQLAQTGDPTIYQLPSPMMEKGNFSAKGGPAYGWDFSFSGLKTAVANLIQETAKSRARKNVMQRIAHLKIMSENLSGAKRISSEHTGDASDFFSRDELVNLAASIQQAIINVLVEKTARAVQTYHVPQVMVAGGVAANQALSSMLRKKISRVPVFTRRAALLIPPPALCTDNGAMIAAAAFFQKPTKDSFNLQADPNLSL